jgi:hypothetical protein
MTSISSQVIFLEEENKSLLKKIQDLENVIQKRDDALYKLKLALQIERFKTHLFSQIISTNTEIKLGDIYKEEEDNIVLTNFPNGNIPVIVKDYLEENKQENKQEYNITVKKKTTQNLPGKNFRTVKNQVELTEEKPEEQEQKIRETEEAFEEIVQENNMDVSYKETTDSIEILFEDVVKNRIYKKFLINMKELRNKLLGKLNLNEYTNLIKTHVSRLEDIFTKKKYDMKKISSTVLLSLSALDQRLIYYNSYYNSELEPDDIQRLKICMKVNSDHPTRYVPFSISDSVQKICNYSLCIYTLKDILKRVIVNPFGFSNVVYLQLEKSSSEDPYSFYILEKIETDGKRCWKMECRLDDFSKQLSEQIKNYSISMFRKIYFDMFNDNIYREDYTTKSPAAHQDCEQLLLNILTLSRPKTFCDTIRKIILKYSTIPPTKIDKFNFTRDDPIAKRNFFQEKDDNKELTAIIQRLFDNISPEIAEKNWQTRLD